MGEQLDVVAQGLVAWDEMVWVSNLPGPEGAAVALRQEIDGGGMAANFAVALARLGGRVGLIAALGGDTAGQQLREHLQGNGIDLAHCPVRPAAGMTRTVMYIDPQATRTGVLYHLDTILSLRPEEINAAYLAQAPVFFTDQTPPEAAVAAARLARRLGKTVVTDMQVGLDQSSGLGITAARVRATLAYTDIFAPSRAGLTSLMQIDDVDQALEVACRRYPDKVVVVTLGAQGSVIGQGERRVVIPAYPVEVIDTTGAGDVYHAAFVYAFCLRGWTLEQAGHFASAAAALKCRQVGAQRGAPTLAEVRAFCPTCVPEP
ncbi:MAG: carbohydrate kinase family protein [Chloroflexota bacterium]